MQATAEQLAILSAFTESEDNLLITARAGAAKTTTLVMLTKATQKQVLCIAFNKSIQLELQERLPENAVAKTMNALGFRAIFNYWRKKSTIDDSKMFNILKDLFEDLSPADKKYLEDDFSDLLTFIKEAKQSGYYPKATGSIKPVLTLDQFLESNEFKAQSEHIELLDKALEVSFQQAFHKGIFDFNDQIYLPAIIPGMTFEHFPIVMVDEAQDLSTLNHVLLSRIAKQSRVIAVGDPCQAIYGFRGASEKSMPELKDRFNMRELFLTICFRSAEDIIKAARWRAPDMQWRPGAPKGSVTNLSAWGPHTVEDGDAIICRNNAPLFAIALRLIRAGRYPELSNGDMIKGLLTIMRKLGKPSMSASDALIAVEGWYVEAEKKTKAIGLLKEKRECLFLFLEDAKTLGDAITALQALQNRTGRIKLMTGHKSKGLEFNRVFFLDDFLLSKEGQDLNIKYVIQTRARESLFNVRSDGWTEQVQEDAA